MITRETTPVPPRIFNKSGVARTSSGTLSTILDPVNQYFTTQGQKPCNRLKRWYEPTTGKWHSNDPIGISGGLNQYVFCGNNPVMFMDPFGLTTPREFFTEGYENIGWNPYTWYYHCNYGGADNPVGIGDPDHVPRPFIDALDRQAYYPHDRRYSKARADGLTFSGQLWRQGWADMMLAGRLWSQSWRWTSEDGLTGLHGQIHGTLAAVWFPIQSTGQLAVGTVVRAGEWIWSVGRRVVRPVKMKERIKNV